MFQFPPFALLINSNNYLMIVGLSHSEILGSKAVSYTHLDVYKRQSLRRLIIPVVNVTV